MYATLDRYINLIQLNIFSYIFIVLSMLSIKIQFTVMAINLYVNYRLQRTEGITRQLNTVWATTEF